LGLQIFQSPAIREALVPLILSKVLTPQCLIPIHLMTSATLAILYYVLRFPVLLPWFSTFCLQFSFRPFVGLHLTTTFFPFLYMYTANFGSSRKILSLLQLLLHWSSFSIYPVTQIKKNYISYSRLTSHVIFVGINYIQYTYFPTNIFPVTNSTTENLARASF